MLKSASYVFNLNQRHEVLALLQMMEDSVAIIAKVVTLNLWDELLKPILKVWDIFLSLNVDLCAKSQERLFPAKRS